MAEGKYAMTRLIIPYCATYLNHRLFVMYTFIFHFKIPRLHLHVSQHVLLPETFQNRKPTWQYSLLITFLLPFQHVYSLRHRQESQVEAHPAETLPSEL